MLKLVNVVYSYKLDFLLFFTRWLKENYNRRALTQSIGQAPMWVRVHLQTVKTQNKCCIMRRFICGYTAYKKLINK